MYLCAVFRIVDDCGETIESPVLKKTTLIGCNPINYHKLPLNYYEKGCNSSFDMAVCARCDGV